MKDILTNLIFGGITSIVLVKSPVLAGDSSQKITGQYSAGDLSAKALGYVEYQGVFIPNSIFVFEPEEFDYFISLEDKEYVKKVIQQSNVSTERFAPTTLTTGLLDSVDKEVANLRKRPLLRDEQAEDLVLGTHNSFWDGESKSKYWGVTTVKTWGGEVVDDLSLKRLDYFSTAPLLAPGASALTISGGNPKGLKKQNTQLDKVGDFNGGVAFHQSLAPELTVGLGFVYEDFLLGFSQFTYQPENFPLRTTVSLLQKEDGVEVFSHLKLQPSDSIVFNLYGDDREQKFDFNWGVISGLTLTADGNSESDSLRAGAKLAVKNEWLSVLAQAQLDNDNDVQWQFNSRLGRFQLKYSTDNLKTNSEVQFDFNDLKKSDFQLSFFVKNQSRERKNSEDNLTTWGWNVYSADKIAKNVNRWEFKLGYGQGSEGEGAIASMGFGLNPSLSLKLTYEEVSLVSDETRIKFQLSSQ